MNERQLLIDETIKKIEFIFRYGGINIKSGGKIEKKDIKSKIIYIFNFVAIKLQLVGVVYSVVDEIRAGKSLLVVTAVAPSVAMSSLGLGKGVLLVLNEKLVEKLTDNLRNFERRGRGRQSIYEKHEIINKERSFLNIVITVINLLYAVVIIMYGLSPIVIIVSKYLKSHEIELILPFPVVYPFDPFRFERFPFVFLHQIGTAWSVAFQICCGDYYFFICCTFIRIQFILLHHNIENLFPNQVDERRFLNDDEFKEKFRHIVRWHQDLIESVVILENIYTKSTLLNLICSTFVICLAGFNLSMEKNFTFILTFISFLFMSTFQIFFVCFFADLLTTASGDIADAVYQSRWYMAEPKVRRNLLLIQTRSQQPCTLTAYGFADVNLNSFMRVLSTAWSYFALLQTLYSREL